MMRLRRIILAAGVIGVGTVAGAQEPLGPLRWLAGCWELRSGSRVVLEMWMPPLGDLMLGSSRTLVGATTREFEHLRIKAETGKLVYTALPSGQREASFPATMVSDTAVTFENPSHDFPQRIAYRRRGADSLIARVEGPGPNNSTRGFDLAMRRASCTESGPLPPPPPPPDTVIIDADDSPDGKRRLIVKAVGQNWELYVMGSDGSGLRRLTDHPQVDYQPAWSPDGQRIAFVSTRERHQEIYVMAADGSQLVQLTRGTTHNSEPAWSPDGRSIAFRSERDGAAQVYVMQADGSEQRALTSGAAGGGSPSWSPDGRKIAFASMRTGRNEVFVMNADGTGQTQLTTSAQGHSGAPSWSHDGAHIAFWTSRDGNDEVYVMNADGSNVVNVTRDPARDYVLGWTADGAHVLFRSTRDRRANDIYRMKPDGSDLARVTTTR